MSIASVQSDAITPFAARPGLVPRWESRVFTESGPSEQSYAIAKVLRDRDVTTLFQPIVRLTSGEIIGYEALTRPPADSPFTSPVELFAAAAHCGALTRLELLCCEKAISSFSRLELPGRLFMNANPTSIVDMHANIGVGIEFLRNARLSADRITVELTEQQKTLNFEELSDALLLIRSLGVSVAIDDLGQGFASLWLWSKVNPEYVKIDMHFVQGIQQDPIKFQFLKSIQQIADGCGARLIAEGIEEKADLLVLRDLGIAYGQGYLIAKPTSTPGVMTDPRIQAILRSGTISVFPEIARLPNSRMTTGEKLLIRANPIGPDVACAAVFERFEVDAELQALPVVNAGMPVGLINRNKFLLRFMRRYGKELYGKRPCTFLMDSQPLILEKSMSIQEICETLTRVDPRHLSEGFILADNGRYAGVGRGQDMIREITTMQLDAARYANPLTGLPGNVPIDEHISRLLAARIPFVVAYADLNHFKAFNDIYGYRRGDNMIKLAAQTLSASCNPRMDFIGHVGGDDFILLFQSADWESRCERVLEVFAQDAQFLFDEPERIAGVLKGEDRVGRPETFPLTSLAIGIVKVEPGLYTSHLHVSTAASEAKKQAKRLCGNAMFVERRQPEDSRVMTGSNCDA